MAQRRSGNRKQRLTRRSSTENTEKTAKSASTDRQNTASRTQRAAQTGVHPFLIDATLSSLGIQPAGTETRAEHAAKTRQRNIQRAMKGTGTSTDEVPNQVLDVVASGGMPLENSVRQDLESRMDADFSNVRIHTGARAAEAAEAIDAKAFTCGNSIVFNAGEYDPQSTEGQFLLAHELAHVTQQNGGAPLSMMPQDNAELEIDPDPQLERQADEAAKEALGGRGGPATVSRLGTDVHVQRVGKDKAAKYASIVAADLDDETIADRVEWAKQTDITPEELERRQEFEKALLAEKAGNESGELEKKLEDKRKRLQQLRDELSRIENEVVDTDSISPELSDQRWETAEESAEIQQILTELEGEKAEFEQYAEEYMKLTEMTREDLKKLLGPLEAVKEIAVGDAQATLRDSVKSLFTKAVKKLSGIDACIDTIYKRLKDADLVYGSWRTHADESGGDTSKTRFDSENDQK